MFELSNEQRDALGLERVEPHWQAVPLPKDPYRPESLVYFDGDLLRKHVVSTPERYGETQYAEQTVGRSEFVAKTTRGKAQRITAATLEKRTPKAVYFYADNTGRLLIANHTTQTTFYDSYWERSEGEAQADIPQLVGDFVNGFPPECRKQLREFKNATRKHVAYAPGDFFAMKISLGEYAFGRILLDLGRLKAATSLPDGHTLNHILGKSLLVAVYAHVEKSPEVDLVRLASGPRLPSTYIMDNRVYYGEYQIVGHADLLPSDLDLPMSYGMAFGVGEAKVDLQWGLIYRELPVRRFSKYLESENELLSVGNPNRTMRSPYSYHSVGFGPHYSATEIRRVAADPERGGFDHIGGYQARFDLRNPRNSEIRAELMRQFGLRPGSDYAENCRVSRTMGAQELLSMLNARTRESA